MRKPVFTIRQAVAHFSGYDTYCRPVEVAYRADGVAFSRMCGARTYTRWAEDKKVPSLADAAKAGFVEWGFKTLTGGMLPA